MTTTEKEWSDMCDAARMTISRAIIHMRTGLFSTSRADTLHAALLERLPIKFVSHCNGTRLVLNRSGIHIQINPNSIDHTDIPSCSAQLRHAEQHFFLSHPSRKRNFIQQCKLESLPFHEPLFHFCADIEANEFISGHTDSNTIKREHVVFTEKKYKLSKAMSAEAMYRILLPKWQEDNAPFLDLLAQYNGSCSKEWCHQVSRDTNGVIVEKEPINDMLWKLLQRDIDRLLIMARESLSAQELDALPKPTQSSIADVFGRHNIKPTNPHILDSAKKEVERIIIKMLREDPFFGEFLNSCLLEITDSLPTAGVVLLKKHVLLAVNPSFFMKELKNIEERGAVLKHEALHIILKHIIQMRNPKFTDKHLYNIAADIEVNQYIGSPWKLPNGAILLSTFKELKLPENDIAETYYNLLMKARDKKQTSKKIQQVLNGNKHGGTGHSDHRGWGQGQPQPGQGKGQGKKQAKAGDSLLKGVGSAGIGDLPVQEQNIEEMVRQAIAGTKNAGSIPGSILDLSAEWIKARQPAVDWKKKLRVFAKSSHKYTKKSTHRKKNKRYFRWMRQLLSTTKLSADALIYLAKNESSKLPQHLWGDVSDSVKIKFSTVVSNLKVQDDSPIPWAQIPLRMLYQIREQHSDWTWPSWSDVPNTILLQLSIVRTPLDNDDVPPNIIIMMAKKYPEVLPSVDWSHFAHARKGFIKKDFPSVYEMDEISWGILPSQLIVWLIHNSDLLNHLTWNDVPPQMLAGNPYYQYDGQQAFFIERKVPRTMPGVKKQKEYPKLLCILDTSGSVGPVDVEYLFAEVHKLFKHGVEVFVLEADTHPQLFWKYDGQKPYSGGGGTDFNMPFKWVNDVRNGCKTKVMRGSESTQEIVRATFDGVIYLTDGYASTPHIKPYCKLMWIITPGGDTSAVSKTAYSSMVLQLPPYENR